MMWIVWLEEETPTQSGGGGGGLENNSLEYYIYHEKGQSGALMIKAVKIIRWMVMIFVNKINE